MVQHVNIPNSANNLISSLSTGLGGLMHHKLGQLTKQNEQSAFTNKWGHLLGEETTNFLKHFEPEERENILGNLGALLQLQQLSKQQSMGNQQGGLSALQAPQQTEQRPQQENQLQSALQQYFNNPTLGGQRPEYDYSQGQQQPEQQQFSHNEQMQNEQQLTPEQIKIIENLFSSPQQRKEREASELKNNELGLKLRKETRDFSKPYIEKAEKAEANIRNYDRLIKLAKKGGIRSGDFYNALEKVGLQDFGRNGDTQEAQKIISRLAQNVNGVFGSNARIGVFLEKTFQRSLPSLINTAEGIEAISLINKAVSEGEIVKNNVRKDILQKNGGRIDEFTEDEIADRSRPILKQIEEKAFKDAENVTNKKVGGQKFNELPSPSDPKYKNREIRDSQTGKILVTNGKSWVEKK